MYRTRRRTNQSWVYSFRCQFSLSCKTRTHLHSIPIRVNHEREIKNLKDNLVSKVWGDTGVYIKVTTKKLKEFKVFDITIYPPQRISGRREISKSTNYFVYLVFLTFRPWLRWTCPERRRAEFESVEVEDSDHRGFRVLLTYVQFAFGPESPTLLTPVLTSCSIPFYNRLSLTWFPGFFPTL